MDTEKINRLTDALLAFVERTSKEAASETEVEVLPQVASVLVEIIKLNVYQTQNESYRRRKHLQYRNLLLSALICFFLGLVVQMFFKFF